jgi:glutamate-1-semialdehyde 2,1-aminomutase
VAAAASRAPELAGIDSARADSVYGAECRRYEAARPRSRALSAALAKGFYGGVPMHWMGDWPLPFPLVVESAEEATITDVDGHRLADFCLGDTGAMLGHSPAPVARAVARQAARGLTTMLPGPEAADIGPLLRERFGLPWWQVATTATDANRFALRVARAVTGRGRILVFNGCYHGTVDETFLRLREGRPVHRQGLIGQFADLTTGASVVEFNDIAAVADALSRHEIACVITEPALTNSSMVLPEPGFHAALRDLTRRSGTLLLVDETHTISAGPGGYARRFGLEPDFLICGKPIAGGVPAAVWGFTDEVARRLDAVREAAPAGHSGMGTTLSANALALAAMRANLAEVMTEAAYAHMEELAAALEARLGAVIGRLGLPWHVVRLGARVEFVFSPAPLRNGSQAEAHHHPRLERALHIGFVNRGVLIAPFHNMMLISPKTRPSDIDRLGGAFEEILSTLGA